MDDHQIILTLLFELEHCCKFLDLQFCLFDEIVLECLKLIALLLQISKHGFQSIVGIRKFVTLIRLLLRLIVKLPYPDT